MDKYQELYDLTKDGLKEESARFTHLEEKALRYLTFIGLLYGVFGFVLDSGSLFNRHTLVGWLTVFSVAAFLFFSAGVLYYLLSSFRVAKMVIPPMTDELVHFFEDNSYLDSIFALSKGNIEACKENRNTVANKERDLTFAHKYLRNSFISLFVFLVLSMAHMIVAS